MVGEGACLEWLDSELKKHFTIQAEGPFPVGEVGEGEQMEYLKKKMIFCPDGVLMAENPKHVEAMVKAYELDGKKPKSVPEHELLGEPDESDFLDAGGALRFRSALGSAMYLCQDRVDVQFCVKMLSSKMSRPTKQADVCMRHLILYLKGASEYAVLLKFTVPGCRMIHILNGATQQQGGDRVVEAFCDSDWGGNKVTRQSTTSVVICINAVPCYTYCRGQRSIATSSCEAEILACTSAASESLLIRALWSFLVGTDVQLELRSDSSSGRQWLQRAGVGRLKHYQIRLLWLQKSVREKELQVLPVGTRVNVADINTKRLPAKRRKFLLFFLSVVELEGKAEWSNVGKHEFHEFCMEKNMKNALGYFPKDQVMRCILLSQFGRTNGQQMCNANEEPKMWWWNGFQIFMWIILVLFLCGVFRVFQMARCAWLNLHSRLRRIEDEVLENERAIGSIRREMNAWQNRREQSEDEDNWREMHYWERPVREDGHEEDGPFQVFDGAPGDAEEEPEPYPGMDVEMEDGEETFGDFMMRVLGERLGEHMSHEQAAAEFERYEARRVLARRRRRFA